MDATLRGWSMAGMRAEVPVVGGSSHSKMALAIGTDGRIRLAIILHVDDLASRMGVLVVWGNPMAQRLRSHLRGFCPDEYIRRVSTCVDTSSA